MGAERQWWFGAPCSPSRLAAEAKMRGFVIMRFWGFVVGRYQIGIARWEKDSDGR